MKIGVKKMTIKLHEDSSIEYEIIQYLIDNRSEYSDISESEIVAFGWKVEAYLDSVPVVYDRQYDGFISTVICYNSDNPKKLYRVKFTYSSWGDYRKEIDLVQQYYVTRQEYLTPEEYENTK